MFLPSRPMRALRFALLAALLCAPTLLRAAEPRVVNVYNWSDYIDPALLTRFQQQTGITVRYDVYDSLETLEGKLLAGDSGYDVVVPTNEPTFSRLVRAGALAPLDRAAIPALAGLDPALMARLATADPAASSPAATHGAIYLWGTIGLGFDADRVAALAPDADRTSWSLLLDPANARRLAPCGITILDSAIDVIPSLLAAVSRPPDSHAAVDLADAAGAFSAIRPFVRGFAGAGAVEALASGESCLVLTYSGDVIQAAARAREAGRTAHITYVTPREGAQLWFDVLAIPADAPHKAEAAAFIDFILRPENIALVTNKVHYPNAVPASRKLVDPAISADPNVYPPAEAMARFFTVGALPPDVARARSRLWSRLKAAQ